jgi:predicted RNase H-like nuclease (RuvC/YqgF family)
VDFLFQINQQQLEILHILREKEAPDRQVTHQTEETINALAKELQEEAEEIDALNHDDATSRNA